MRAGGEHCRQELAVEVWRGTLPSRATLAVEEAADKEDEEAEEGEGQERAASLKNLNCMLLMLRLNMLRERFDHNERFRPMRGRGDRNCQFCSHGEHATVANTTAHIMFHCPAYEETRMRLRVAIGQQPSSGDPSGFSAEHLGVLLGASQAPENKPVRYAWKLFLSDIFHHIDNDEE